MHIEPKAECADIIDNFSVAELVAKAKSNNSDIIKLLKSHIAIEEVQI